MRTVDPILADAMEKGNYIPVLRVIVRDQNTDVVVASSEEVAFVKLDDLEITVRFESPERVPVVANKTVLVYERGGIVNGTEYVVTSSEFVITDSYWDGTWQRMSGHLIPPMYYSTEADDTYQTVIMKFCTRFGKTYRLADLTNPRWSMKFYPTGKFLILQDAQQFFSVLRQKHFIFATDNGNNEILFYFAFQPSASAALDVEGTSGWVNKSLGRHVQYLWRDEADTIHQTAPSFALSQQFGLVSYVLSFLELGDGVVLAGTYPNGKVFRSTNWGETWTQVASVGGGVYAFVKMDNGVLVFGSGSSLYRSLNNGLTWSFWKGLGGSILSLLYLGNGMLLAGTTSACRVYRSIDYGETWSYTTLTGATWIHGLTNLGNGIVVASVEGTPYAATWRSTDYGATWGWQNLYASHVRSYCVEALGNNIVLAGVSGHIYRSTNGGLSFSDMGQLGTEIAVYKIVYFGSGVVLAGTYPTGQVWLSDDLGLTWSLVQQLGTETDVRALYALSNEKVLAGTGSTGKVYYSHTVNAGNYPIHNLGFMPSTASEPTAYFQFAPSDLDPIPVRLDCQSGDALTITLLNGEVVSIPRAHVVEEFDNTKPMPWRLRVREVEWLANTAAGAMPSTIERVAAYTPLVSVNFDGNLTPAVNNLQALAEAVDDLQIIGPAPATSSLNDVQVGNGLGQWITKSLAEFVDILRTVLNSIYAPLSHSHSYAPTAAQYVTLATDGTLSAERVLTAGVNLALTDGGAGGAATLNVATQSATVFHDVVQAIPTGVWTTIALNNEVSDPQGWHDTVTNNSRIYVPAGEYQVLVQNMSFVSSTIGLRGVHVIDSDGNGWGENIVATLNGLYTPMTLVVQRTISGAGKYIYLQVYQNSGGNLNLNAYCKVTVNRLK